MDKRRANYSAAVEFVKNEVKNDFPVLGQINCAHVVWLRTFIAELETSQQDPFCEALVARAHPDLELTSLESHRLLGEFLSTTDRIPIIESRGNTALLKKHLATDLAGLCETPLEWYGAHCNTRAVLGDLSVRIELDLRGHLQRAAVFTQTEWKNEKIEWMQISILQWIGLVAETTWQGVMPDEEVSKRLSRTLEAWIKLQLQVLS